MEHIAIEEIRRQSGVAFGTSGARGLASAITDKVAYSYTLAFLEHLRETGQYNEKNGLVALGGDLRPSTPRIISACAQAVRDFSYTPLGCGFVPSPALVLYGIREKIPSIMVTGSHIPEDRNGIKFASPTGEISKSDEEGIVGKTLLLNASLFNSQGFFVPKPIEFEQTDEAAALYVRRYTETFPSDLLQGLRIGLYQHSAVGRDLLYEIYTSLGAEVLPLGRSSVFVPVDTEAIRDEDHELASRWAASEKLDALVSTDGDSDRPLISDEHGAWLRGDVIGILTAKFLGAKAVATPVSCNTAVEKCSWFDKVLRTRIGSPYVIAGMSELAASGFAPVVGYEANGGFLLYSDAALSNGSLASLPTRDAVIVHLALLALANERRLSVSKLIAELPERFTESGRIKDYPTEKSKLVLADLSQGEFSRAQEIFLSLAGKIQSVDQTDGLRLVFDNDSIIHLRPSGNAPEFRCYAESTTAEKAASLVKETLSILSAYAL